MIGAEAISQIQICEWLRQLHPEIPYIHIANERQTNPVFGRILKRMGVRKGVSDLFLPKPNDTFSGLWLELKSPTEKLSLNQIIFMNEMIDLGYAAHAAYSFDEAILIIRNFYYIPDETLSL